MLDRFFFRHRQGKEARALALRCEILASELNVLPLNDEQPGRDIVAILQATCALLERLQDRQVHPDPTPIGADPLPQEEAPSPVSVPPIIVHDLPEVIADPLPQEEAPSPESALDLPEVIADPLPLTSPESVPPQLELPASSESAVLAPAATNLMKLSDWVLLARAANVPVKPAVLDEIHRQIVTVLGKEGVTLLNETGRCDYERQAIVGTEPTDDPAQHECIASVVRPGYLFHEQVLRPQEVIVYIHE